MIELGPLIEGTSYTSYRGASCPIENSLQGLISKGERWHPKYNTGTPVGIALARYCNHRTFYTLVKR